MRALHLLVAAALLAGGPLLAQDRRPLLVGQVTDTAGSPIASASVYVVGTDNHVLTNARGEFGFDSLPAGLVSIRSVFIGYKSHQLDSVRVVPGHTARVTLRLEVSRIQQSCDLRAGAASAK